MIDKSQELVVLVDDKDREIGVMEKQKVHHKDTPLHRGISVFIFNQMGEVLVQQRAKSKQTWPGVWSNSCCGHPQPGETYEQAILRRVRQELGVSVKKLQKISDYRYRFERDGVVENEFCPVFRGLIVGEPKPDPAEVEDWRWIRWDEFKKELADDKTGRWSEWCKEEAVIIENNKMGVK